MGKRHSISGIIAFIIFASFFLTACQATPVEEPVISKEDGVYEMKLEQARAEDQAQEQDAANSATPAPRVYLADQHWTEDITLRNFTFHIDLDVEAPSSGVFPVYSVAAADFEDNDERLTRILDYFLKDIVAMRQGAPTKEDYNKEIEMLLRGVFDDESGTYIAPSEEEVQGEVDDLLKAAASAPSEDEFSPTQSRSNIRIPSSLAYQLDNQDVWDIQLEANFLRVSKLPIGVIQPERWALAGTALPNEPAGTQFHNIKISQEDAEAIVSDFGATIMNGFIISSIEKGRIVDSLSCETLTEGWIVECVRSCGDCLPFAYQRYKDGNTLRFSDEAYASSLPLETVSMFVDETGICSLSWMNPLKVEAQATSTIELLPYDKIQEIIRQAIKNSLSWSGDNEHGSGLGNGKVTRVILSSCYIPQKDTPDHFYLTPTWFVLLGFEKFLSQGVSEQAIAINAVDGSRIEIKS